MRLRYVLGFIYYAVKHRGLRHVRWALAAEGLKW